MRNWMSPPDVPAPGAGPSSALTAGAHPDLGIHRPSDAAPVPALGPGPSHPDRTAARQLAGTVTVTLAEGR
jgi:hypothetical protein